ncbi:hypothetical protein R1sor_011549 [Riccia sorocarpa]|uniref:Reverse transcriptase domain-containing protein n=1 Tax=Riccia sorocarpa TaxID=122646 RepID=A0ABD3I1B0_9MARC
MVLPTAAGAKIQTAATTKRVISHGCPEKKWSAKDDLEGLGEVPLLSKSAAEKRRASGEIDRNGCRLSERRDSELEMLDDSVRERKLRSDGLQQEIRSLLGDGNWVVLDYFNQIEIPDDTHGKSTVIRGSKERLWKSLALEKGLVDGFLLYFFAKLKSKWAKETISALVREDGELTSDKGEILEEIQAFYQLLFSAEGESEERELACQEVLHLLTPKVSPGDSDKILVVPDKEEIEKVVFAMKSNKAPGLDGLTIEILQVCWPFVGDDCIRMIHTIWAKKRILKSDCQAVIKLIPKPGDMKLLSNWRRNSLMSLTYKIVAKVLANRLRSLMPSIVDIQQTGFIMGRKITDNILCLKLSQ